MKLPDGISGKQIIYSNDEPTLIYMQDNLNPHNPYAVVLTLTRPLTFPDEYIKIDEARNIKDLKWLPLDPEDEGGNTKKDIMEILNEKLKEKNIKLVYQELDILRNIA